MRRKSIISVLVGAAERSLYPLSQVTTYMYSKHGAEQCTPFDIHSHGVYKSWCFIGNHEYLNVKRSTGCIIQLPAEICRLSLTLALDLLPYFVLCCVVHVLCKWIWVCVCL